MKKIACIICTKDRPEDLSKLLLSLENQTRKADQIIIVDGSDNPVTDIVKIFSSLQIDYITVRPPGLTKQRNVGILNIDVTMDWVGFMDDDLVLENNCLENLEKFLDNHNLVKGVGMVINNQPTISHSIFHKIFLTDLEPGGLITKSGNAAAIRPVKNDLKVEWLYGGATFWHVGVFKEFKFDEWFSGVGYLEDVDFSYRVSRKYELMLASKARCFHYSHPIRKAKLAQLGSWHLVAWWYFTSKYKFNKLLILWSMFGILLGNILIGILRPQTSRLRVAYGNLKAFWVILNGRVSDFKGFQK